MELPQVCSAWFALSVQALSNGTVAVKDGELGAEWWKEAGNLPSVFTVAFTQGVCNETL